MDKNIRLTTIQKKIIDSIKKNNIFSTNEQETKDLKYYNNIHQQIKNLLNELSIEPHEILTLLSNYNGSNETFIYLKNIINGRNDFIINKIYSSDQWNKNIKKIACQIKNNYLEPSNGIIEKCCNDELYNILKDEINTFDILQCKISLDVKNNLKSINMVNLDDQKRIIKKITEIGCLKR